ncbi:MAG: hypothetical protein NT133_00920 [Alphaproteobacteria bacterium]|nr:hypothetical protein [Alphaproteobacteria bacterium]
MSGSANVTLDDGGNLATYMLNQRIHPVLVFGCVDSGKSYMLASTIAYAQRAGADYFQTALGATPFPPGYPHRKERVEWAGHFMHVIVPSFLNGRPIDNTKSDAPFFIPIEITHGRFPQPLKLALLESRGEWYQPDVSDAKNDGIRNFGGFKEEIANILRYYTDGISVIFVCPSNVQDGKGADDFDRNFECMEHFLDEYRKIRRIHKNDSVVLVLSKWESGYTTGSTDEAIWKPPQSAVISKLRTSPASQKFWNAFRAMQGFVSGIKVIVPFSCGWFRDDKREVIPGQDVAFFDNFAENLWKYILWNSPVTREQLFSINPPSGDIHSTLSHRLNRILLGGIV